MIDYKSKNNLDGDPVGIEIWHEPFFKLISLKNKSVLDIGCGAGGFLKYVRDNYTSKVFGIDPNQANVSNLKKEKIDCCAGYAEEFVKENKAFSESFDIVTSFEVLEHVYDYKDLFVPAFSLLKMGGTFYVSTPNAFHIFRILSMILGDHRDPLTDPTRHDFPEHVRLYSRNMVYRALSKSGFSRIKVYGVFKLFGKTFILKNKFLVNYFSQHLVGFGEK